MCRHCLVNVKLELTKLQVTSTYRANQVHIEHACFSRFLASRIVHKRMFYIRMNLRMLQHSNVKCNIRMLILCNKMMYFGDFVVLVPYISIEFILII